MADGLRANGVRVEDTADSLTVHGSAAVPGGATVATHLDLRIAMSFLVLGLVSDAPITVEGHTAPTGEDTDDAQDLSQRRAEEIVRGVLEESPQGRRLRGDELDALLGCYGISLWPVRAVADPDDAENVQVTDATGLTAAVRQAMKTARAEDSARPSSGGRHVRPDA